MNSLATESTAGNDRLRIGWQHVVIVGGPHNRTRYTIPADQDELVLHEDAEPHRYIRVNHRAELHHEGKVAGMFAAGKRGGL